MTAVGINCPNCGAPLRLVGKPDLALCLYCNSAIRIQVEAEDAIARVESVIPAEVMDEVKHLLLAGRREEALRIYQEKTGTSLTDAQQAIQEAVQRVSYSIIRRQQLTRRGVFLTIFWILLLLFGVYTIFFVKEYILAGILLAGMAGFQLFIFAPSIRMTLRFLKARRAQATARWLAPIGVVAMRKMQVHTFLVLLDVHPEGREPFQAEILLPVRDENLSKMQPGVGMQVKYLPNDLSQVIFDQKTI